MKIYLMDRTLIECNQIEFSTDCRRIIVDECFTIPTNEVLRIRG